MPHWGRTGPPFVPEESSLHPSVSFVVLTALTSPVPKPPAFDPSFCSRDPPRGCTAEGRPRARRWRRGDTYWQEGALGIRAAPGKHQGDTASQAVQRARRAPGPPAPPPAAQTAARPARLPGTGTPRACGWGRGPRGEGRARRLTFLRRLHGAAGGRRGPQSFSDPADCSRRAERKLGRDWKTGTWHPRGGEEEERARREERGGRRRPGRVSRRQTSPRGRAPARAQRRTPRGNVFGGVCARGDRPRPGHPSGVAAVGLGGCARAPVPAPAPRPGGDCAGKF